MLSKRNRTDTGWMKLVAWCALIIMVLSDCGQAAAPTTAPQAAQAVSGSTAGNTAAEQSPTTVPATATQAPTATVPPTATPTQAPTATATALPSATPMPALAVLPDGFDAWCAPTSYAGSMPTSAEPPADARKLTKSGEQLQVLIPAAYCALIVRFNQALPAGAQLSFLDSGNAFIKSPLQPVDGHPDEGWVAVKHDYVVNPPLWNVTYRLAVTDASGKELWNNTVKFYKNIDKKCPFGDTPNPVTLWCLPTDPWEIEPNPGATYPYDHNALPTYEPKH